MYTRMTGPLIRVELASPAYSIREELASLAYLMLGII